MPNIVFFIIYNKYFLFFKYCLYLEQIEDDIIELNHTSIGGYILGWEKKKRSMAVESHVSCSSFLQSHCNYHCPLIAAIDLD